MLLAIAAGLRIILSLVEITHGLSSVPGLALSTWGDFNSAYLHWLELVRQGLLPYRDFYTYKYTPLFLYSLYPFFLGSPLGALIPIVAADIATVAVIYLFAKEYGTNQIAFAAALIYAVSPFVLYYEDYLWLSSQPMTLFIILSVYLLKTNRSLLSSAALAIAVMFKQEALFILPAYLILFAQGNRGQLWRGVGVFLAVCFIVSLPWLILAPRDYFYSLSYIPLNGLLGPGEPSAVKITSASAAYAVANSAPGCGLSTIPGVFTGTICGKIVNVQEFANSLIIGRLDQIASFLSPLLLLLLAPALYVVRKAPNFYGMLCIFSMLSSLWLFSVLANQALGYYFIPVYALIFASIANLRTFFIGLVGTVRKSLRSRGPPSAHSPPRVALFVRSRR